MKIIDQVCNYVVDNQHKSVDDDLSCAVAKAMLDTVSCGIAARKEDVVVRLLKSIKFSDSSRLEQGNSWNLVCNKFNLSVENSALLNGTACHALDLDDTGASTQSHPSAILFPVLWALIGGKVVSWNSFAGAYITGLQVFNRMSQMLPELHTKGWHPSSVIGSLAATAAASTLLNLNYKEVSNALSLSASTINGLVSNFGTMAKPLHIGIAARNTVSSIAWAQQGIEASSEVLDSSLSWFNILGYDISDEYSLNLEKGCLAIKDPGLNVKLYPSCSLSHRVIHIIINLLNNNKFDFTQIEKVTCYTTPKAKGILSIDRPKYGLQGKFSIPYIVSRVLVSSNISISHFTNESISDPNISKLMEKIDFQVHPGWNSNTDPWTPDKVSILLRNGCILEGSCKYPPGHAKNPISEEDLIVKAINCLSGESGLNSSHSFIDKVLKCDPCADVNDILSILRR